MTFRNYPGLDPDQQLRSGGTAAGNPVNPPRLRRPRREPPARRRPCPPGAPLARDLRRAEPGPRRAGLLPVVDLDHLGGADGPGVPRRGRRPRPTDGRDYTGLALGHDMAYIWQESSGRPQDSPWMDAESAASIAGTQDDGAARGCGEDARTPRSASLAGEAPTMTLRGSHQVKAAKRAGQAAGVARPRALPRDALLGDAAERGARRPGGHPRAAGPVPGADAIGRRSPRTSASTSPCSATSTGSATSSPATRTASTSASTSGSRSATPSAPACPRRCRSPCSSWCTRRCWR